MIARFVSCMDHSVRFEFEHGLVKGEILYFYLPEKVEFGAARIALTEALNDALRSCIQAVRRQEYEDGWRDAKAKKRGIRTWFSNRLWLRP